MARSPLRQQPDLLDWQPPATVARFEERTVRATSLHVRICKALSQALKDSNLPRQEIAQRMTQFLGEDVTRNMIDAYASQARAEHTINLPRFIALIHATGDRRLLELLAEMFSWTVIERRYLPLIEVAAIRDKEDELIATRKALMREARRGGAL